MFALHSSWKLLTSTIIQQIIAFYKGLRAKNAIIFFQFSENFVQSGVNILIREGAISRTELQAVRNALLAGFNLRTIKNFDSRAIRNKITLFIDAIRNNNFTFFLSIMNLNGTTDVTGYLKRYAKMVSSADKGAIIE